MTEDAGAFNDGPGHEQYAKEHALFHTWRASKYYSAAEGIKEMLIIERHQHQDEQRTQRIAALEFVVKLLEKLTDNELTEVVRELAVYFAYKEPTASE